jgi:release factor glutamine methyltransferase
MQLLGDVLKKAADYLQQKSVSEPRLSADWLLAHVLGIKRMDLYLNFDRPMVEAELNTYRSHIARRAKNEPVSYIIGEQPFMGLNLKVNSHVLIPRQETEILVEKVLEYLKSQDPLTGLDLCTGSGAIACAIKKYQDTTTMHASDISFEALEMAKKNASSLNLDIVFHQSDLVSSIEDKFDFVCCNPPYIVQKVIDTLDEQVKKFEPHLALSGGFDGLEFYRRLASELPKILKDQARVFLEIGFDQAEAVIDIFSNPPFYGACCIKDLNENNRCVMIDYTASIKDKVCLAT